MIIGFQCFGSDFTSHITEGCLIFAGVAHAEFEDGHCHFGSESFNIHMERIGWFLSSSDEVSRMEIIPSELGSIGQ